jgi:hypothetical protein
MFTREFVHAGRTIRFVVTRSPLGWDVRQERDNRIVQEAHYSDWHRVERAVQIFERMRLEALPEPAES